VNAEQHYKAAEKQLDEACNIGLGHPIARARVAMAQVHATLAAVQLPMNTTDEEPQP
jgi:hypothetical protein